MPRLGPLQLAGEMEGDAQEPGSTVICPSSMEWAAVEGDQTVKMKDETLGWPAGGEVAIVERGHGDVARRGHRRGGHIGHGRFGFAYGPHAEAR